MIDEAGCDLIDSAGIKSLKVFSNDHSSKNGLRYLLWSNLSRGKMVHVGEAIGMIQRNLLMNGTINYENFSRWWYGFSKTRFSNS